MTKPDLRVALLGQGFMGKAHSNAYVQAPHFYDLPYRVRRTLLCGRDPVTLAEMAQRWEWESTSTDWRAAIDRRDTWKMDPAQAGSGVADDLLTHLLDTALYLNGPVTEGIATARTFLPDRAIDDAFVALLKFANGSVGTFEATRFGMG